MTCSILLVHGGMTLHKGGVTPGVHEFRTRSQPENVSFASQSDNLEVLGFECQKWHELSGPDVFDWTHELGPGVFTMEKLEFYIVKKS